MGVGRDVGDRSPVSGGVGDAAHLSTAIKRRVVKFRATIFASLHPWSSLRCGVYVACP